MGALRILATFFVGMVYVAETCIFGGEGGAAAMFAFLVGGLATAVAMQLAIGVGSMIRRAPEWNARLNRQRRLSPMIVAVGLSLFVVARVPSLRWEQLDPEFGIHMVSRPNPMIGLVGWLLFVFGMMNYTR